MFETILYTHSHVKHYLDRYVKFIRSRSNIEISHTTERHHICPKSIFPTYSNFKKNEWNLVNLTFREHFLAHWLLWKSFPGKQTAYPFKAMCDGVFNHKMNRFKPKISSRVYETLRYEVKAAVSNASKGMAPAKCPITGTRLGKISCNDPRWETGEIVGISKGDKRGPHSEETLDKMRKSSKGKKKSKEHVENLKKSRVGKVNAKNIHTGECKWVTKEEFESNDDLVGTTYGISVNRPNPMTGMAVARDLDGNSLGRISLNDPRWKTGEIVHHNTGRKSPFKGTTTKYKGTVFVHKESGEVCRIRPEELEQYENLGWIKGRGWNGKGIKSNPT